MRKRFDQELQQLHEDLIEMGTLNEKALEKIILLFRDMDPGSMRETANDIKDLENRVDQLEQKIQGQALRLLYTQQPVAKDLRSISSALNIITDMERISDQAYDIAEVAMFFAGKELIKQPVHIVEMIEKCIVMMNRSVDAFVTQNLEVANRVIQADDEVDQLFLAVRDELIDLINQNREYGEQAIDFMIIAKYLERIADHAVNIAEWVIFLITGVHKNAQLM